MTHPSICQVFDVGHESGTPFLVMEHLDGQPLSLRLMSTGAFKASARGRWCRMAAVG